MYNVNLKMFITQMLSLICSTRNMHALGRIGSRFL